MSLPYVIDDATHHHTATNSEVVTYLYLRTVQDWCPTNEAIQRLNSVRYSCCSHTSLTTHAQTQAQLTSSPVRGNCKSNWRLSPTDCHSIYCSICLLQWGCSSLRSSTAHENARS